jgi:hypothetical protein
MPSRGALLIEDTAAVAGAIVPGQRAFLRIRTASLDDASWIQADIPQFMSEPLSANLLSVTESGQQKGAGR